MATCRLPMGTIVAVGSCSAPPASRLFQVARSMSIASPSPACRSVTASSIGASSSSPFAVIRPLGCPGNPFASMRMVSAPDDMPCAATLPPTSAVMLTSSVVPVILPVALSSPANRGSAAARSLTASDHPRSTRFAATCPLASSVPARPVNLRCDRFRSLPCSVAARLSRPSSPTMLLACGCPPVTATTPSAVSGGGVAVDRGMQVQHKAALQRDLTHRRERRQVGEPQRGVNASPLAGQCVRVGGEQTMAERDVHRSIRRVQFDVGLDCQRIAGEQVRVRTRHVQSGHLAVQPKLPRVAGDVGGEPVDAESGRGQRVDVQAAGSIRGAEGAAHMRVDRHCLPADVRVAAAWRALRPIPSGRRLRAGGRACRQRWRAWGRRPEWHE